MVSGKKKLFLTCAGIFALALGVRLLYLYQSSGNPTFYCPIVDSETYDDIARQLASGNGLSDKFFGKAFFTHSFWQ